MSDVVRQCYNHAFDKIEVPEKLQENIERIVLDQKETSREQNAISGKNHEYKGFYFRSRKSVLAVILIAVLLLGAAGVYAAVSGLWSRGLTGMVYSDPDEQQILADSGFAIPLTEENQGLAVTCSGVTITPNMILTDGKVAYLSFLVEGYDYEIGSNERPAFSDEKDSPLQAILSGDDLEQEIRAARIYMEGFYSDVIIPADGGVPYYTDGTPARINSDGSTAGRYRDENGNLEYIIKVMTTGGTVSYDDPYGFDWETSDSLYGTIFHIEFRNLGTTNPEFGTLAQEQSSQGEGDLSDLLELKYKNVVEGTWTFDIIMPEQGETAEYIYTYELNEQIEDTDCTIESVTVSPISVQISYTASKSKNKRGGDNIFELKGLILEDGTVLQKTTFDQPLVLYGDSAEERQELIALDQLTDPEQVEALLVNLYAYPDEIEISLRD